MTAEISSQVGLAAVTSYVIQLLKNSKYFPLLNTQTAVLNRIAAVVLAGFAALGVHLSYDKDTGTLIMTGMTLVSLGHFAWNWLIQYCLTHGWYAATTKT